MALYNVTYNMIHFVILFTLPIKCLEKSQSWDTFKLVAGFFFFWSPSKTKAFCFKNVCHYSDFFQIFYKGREFILQRIESVLFALNPHHWSVLISLLTLFPTHCEDGRRVQGLILQGFGHNVR